MFHVCRIVSGSTIVSVVSVIISIWKKIFDQNQFLARKMVPVLDYPRYSPDLSPPDYFLFPKSKMELKGHRFATIETIQESVTQNVKNIAEADLKKLGEGRARSCIECNGDYFE